jgi:hypothetical protein
VVAAASAIGLAVAGFLVALGELPVWPFILVVSWLWVSAVVRRNGWAWAVVTVSVVATTTLYGVSVGSAAVGKSFHATMALVVGLAGLLALRDLFLHGGVRAPRASALWVGAVPLVWLGGATVAACSAGGSQWDWALMGDSANNVLFARDVIIDHGTPFAGANPVPLPHLAVALGMAGEGTSSVASDIASYVWVWHLLIVATVAFAGLLGRQVALRVGVRTWNGVAVATVLPAAGVLSWVATGTALRFGFINAHLSVFLVLLSLAIGLMALNPSTGFVLQVMVAVDLLVTWSPLAAIPVVMALFHLVAAVRRSPSRREWLYLGLGGALGLGYAVATLVAAAGAVEAAFASGGAVWGPSMRTITLVLAALVIAGLLIWRRVDAVGLWVISAALALVIALAATLVLAGGEWTYYPLKMAWFALIVAAVVLAPLAAPLFAIVAPRVARLGPALALLAGVAVVVGPPVASHATARGLWIVDPLTQLVAPYDGGGDQLYGLVEALGTDDDGIALLWGSGARYEREVDFWVLSEASGRFSAGPLREERFALRAFAYAQLQPEEEQLCDVRGLIGAPVVVYTADPALDGRIRNACRDDAPTIQTLDTADPTLIARVLSNQ